MRFERSASRIKLPINSTSTNPAPKNANLKYRSLRSTRASAAALTSSSFTLCAITKPPLLFDPIDNHQHDRKKLDDRKRNHRMLELHVSNLLLKLSNP